MNLPERFPPDDPREWMNRARSDLTQAKSQVPGVYLENLCFNAQQAAAQYYHISQKVLNRLAQISAAL